MTWEGMEADKGATAWYVHRYVAPHARIDFVPYGKPLGEGIAFDVPQARYRRTHNATSLELLLRDYPSSDPVIDTLAHIVHDIEINAWGVKRYPQSAILEAILKDVASRYADGNIPLTCFLPFYDGVYRWIDSSAPPMDKPLVPRQCTPPLNGGAPNEKRCAVHKTSRLIFPGGG